MKKLYISIFLMLVSTYGFCQWIQQNPIQLRNNLYSICFPNANTGIAVGDHSILKTTDGGVNWTKMSFDTNCVIYSVYFTDKNTGYAVGYVYHHEIILITKNGGESWTKQKGEIKGQKLASVLYINANTGYIVGTGGIILKTTNKGKKWKDLSINEHFHLHSVFFINKDTGFAVGCSITHAKCSSLTHSMGQILKTANGGTNWTNISVNGTGSVNSVCFTNENIGYAVGSEGIILKTYNEGKNWDTLSSGTKEELMSIYFINRDTGYVVGSNGIILKTKDGGKSWTGLSIGSNDLYSVIFTDDKNGYIVGQNGIILKTINGGDKQ